MGNILGKKVERMVSGKWVFFKFKKDKKKNYILKSV